MSEVKVGDKVVVVGPSAGGKPAAEMPVETVAEIRDGYAKISFTVVQSYWFPVSELAPAPRTGNPGGDAGG